MRFPQASDVTPIRDETRENVSRPQEATKARAVTSSYSGPVPRDPVMVARFVPCTCEDSQYEVFHAVVDLFPIELCRGNAAALSYAIGDFDPKHEIIGHQYGKPANPVIMKLGAEWDAAEVQARLIEICQEYNAIWIDQLCIEQEREQIQVMLGKIPSIYNTFDVLILLPGSLCSCISQFVNKIEINKLPEDDVASQLVETIDGCRNSVAFCSYAYRIWTRSEILYSRSVRIIWSRRDSQVCVKPDDNQALSVDEGRSEQEADDDKFFCLGKEGSEQKLALYAREQFVRNCAEAMILYEDQNPRDYAEMKHYESQVQFIATLENFLYHEHQLRFRLPDEVQFGKIQVARFLIGQPLQQCQPPHLKVRDATIRFTFDLGNLRDSARIASESLDYVLAIWPDCPGYVIPNDYHSLTLSELLESAILQYERLNCESPAVQLPSGLFHDSSPTGVWRPTLYLKNQSIKCASQVYGATLLNCIGLDYTLDSFILLRTRRPRTSTYKSRLSRAKSYLDSFAGSKTAEVLQFMRRVVVDWPKNTGFVFDLYYRYSGEGVRILEGTSPPPKQKWPHPGLGIHMFLEKLFTKQYTNQGWTGLPEIDHHDLVYRLVAERFGVEADICKASNLKLMVGDGLSPHIGLTKLPNLNVQARKTHTPSQRNSLQKALSSVQQIFSSQPPPETLSIAIDHLSKSPTVYDAIKVQHPILGIDPSYRKEAPQYKVVGVWLAGKNLRDEEIGAWPLREGWDALLV